MPVASPDWDQWSSVSASLERWDDSRDRMVRFGCSWRCVGERPHDVEADAALVEEALDAEREVVRNWSAVLEGQIDRVAIDAGEVQV